MPGYIVFICGLYGEKNAQGVVRIVQGCPADPEDIQGDTAFLVLNH